ncbi:MAG: MFS transporter [Nevskia sp.]|nr:MFS transporter [Nevskia sp.]
MRLCSKAAFYLLASIVVSFLAGSSAPTPLYALYQARWGFSPIVVTLIFGIYAVAVLLSLLFAGRLSDHLGRRPVLLAAIGAQTLTMILLATAGGLVQLLLARVLQGLAAGAAVAALGAGMIDLDKTRGATANAVAPAFGTATGGILAGFMVQYLPAPTHLVYAFLAAVFVLQGVGVILMPETIAPQPGALASLKPQFRLPRPVREPLLLALPVLVAAWALASFYGALGPTLVRGLSGSGSALFGGLALFALAASAGLGVLVLQHREARAMMSFGAAALAVGVGLTAWTLPQHSLLLFFLGTVIAGVGFGTGFQGAVRSIVPFAAAHERAGVLSIVFIVSYLALGVPAVAAGALLARHGDILGTAREFGTAVMGLALLAVLATGLRALTRRPAAA